MTRKRYYYKLEEIKEWEENKLFKEHKWTDQDDIIEFLEQMRSLDPVNYKRKNDPTQNSPTFEHKLYILWRRIYQKQMEGANN